MGSFKDRIIRLLKNIVEEAEREKNIEAQKALARQASNPASSAVEAKSETQPDTKDTANTEAKVEPA